MTKTKITSEMLEPIENVIFTVRGQRVMLDSDLAVVYGVTTFNLNKAVRRNADRFPDDFAFQITAQAVANLKFQIGISSSGHGGRRKPAWVYTEHGAVMAANVLNSKRAAQMSVFVVRAFIKMRAALSDNREQARKLAALEKELKERLNVHEAAIVSILQRVMDIIDPPALPEPSKKQIGFQVRERPTAYRVKRKSQTPATLRDGVKD